MIEIGIKRYNNIMPINSPNTSIKINKYIIKVHATYLIALLGLVRFLIRKIKVIIAGRTDTTPQRIRNSPKPGQHSALASGINRNVIIESRQIYFILFFIFSINIVLTSALFCPADLCKRRRGRRPKADVYTLLCGRVFILVLLVKPTFLSLPFQ